MTRSEQQWSLTVGIGAYVVDIWRTPPAASNAVLREFTCGGSNASAGIGTRQEHQDSLHLAHISIRVRIETRILLSLVAVGPWENDPYGSGHVGEIHKRKRTLSN